MRTTRPRSTHPADTALPHTAVTGSVPAPRSANRAERRAARRGRSTEAGTGPAAPRTAGPAPHVKPAHVRTDFAARRTG